jgi:hypothetical protein
MGLPYALLNASDIGEQISDLFPLSGMACNMPSVIH